MKCIDCGHAFSSEETEKDLKVELNNPGIVKFKGKAVECPECGEKYTKEESIVELLDDFEKNHEAKTNLLHN